MKRDFSRSRGLIRLAHPELRLGLGLRVGGGGAVGPRIYIDPTQVGTGHAGTYADPFSTADAVTWMGLQSGNLHGTRIRFKAGTIFNGRVVIQNADNYRLEPYGSGAAPIISNHTDVSALTWTADDGALGGPTADVYFCPVGTWTAGETAVTFVDGANYEQCESRSNYADLIGALYQCNETRYSTWPFLQFWDTASNPDRMWIRVPAGFDPNAATCLIPVASQTAMTLEDGERVTVADLVLQMGANAGLLSQRLNGLTLERVEARNIGGNMSAAQDVFNLVGTSKAVRMTDAVMRACKAYRSMTRTSSHGVEISWLDNFTIDDLEVRDIRLHGIEFWESCSRGVIRRMKARQTSTAMQAQIGSVDGTANADHSDILVQNLDCVQRQSYLNKGTTGGNAAGGSGVVLSPFSINRKIFSQFRVMNGSFDLDGAHALYAYINSDVGLGDGVLKFKNNACRFSQLTNIANGGVYFGALDAVSARFVVDRNVYQFGNNATNLFKQGTAGPASSLSAAETQWDAISGATTNEDNSQQPAAGAALFVTPAGTIQSTNLHLAAGTVAIGLGDAADADTPTTDFDGVARGAAVDTGAYEYV